MTSRFTPRRLRDPFQPPAAAAAYCRLPTRHPVPACPAAPSGLPGEGPEPEPGDPCAGPGAQQDYDLPLHLAAVVVLLGVSLAGSLGPVALHLSSASSAVSTAIRLGTFFGFGTILSTSFIHMLLPAAQSFASPCLPRAWADSFDGWAYLFVTLAGQHLRQQAAAQQQQQVGGDLSRSQSLAHSQLEDGCHAWHVSIITALSSKEPAVQHAGAGAAGAAADGESGAAAAAEQGQAEAAAAAADGEAGGSADEQEGACEVCSTLPLLGHQLPPQQPVGPQQGAAAPAPASQIIGLYLAEAGIIFHSVMIGLTLGVTSGTGFKTLLVALSFHQFFEGFAIGSAAVDSGLSAREAGAMGLAFSVTTPAGIAIGIAVRESFNRNAAAALLASGICDALSAGILIYTVLCELITPMMTDSRWLRSQRWPLQVAAFLSFYAGAGAMAAVGKFA
ncbi:hypothetical protein CHLNCDRAFT_141589 [Chlorella variabilis]|uniref:Uncharacterized protein n=1 Tax=Chlorella variabilis TaxID=554065 RepID=E1ZT98_CHLVA|nr:hypothetical protein CHLNCDRAFT_141589 [Chlorella variabilis]EFN50937.1 hypothetical protein CHLNCDRAFT_141589 [Chlorella variabilis]|eukprot:XP_005843039.1 hypothetical protein CHLNCDRAFT_141589 [Chlorella variabilis]